MRKMDCDQIRPQVGEIVIGGKTLKVMRRTIGQEITHDVEFKKTSKELKKLTEKGSGPGSDEYSEALNTWLKREIQIFIPEFGDREFQSIDHAQRDQILAIIFERDPETVSVEEPTKKKNRKANRRSGK